jgi:hypothetical protein
MSPGGEILDGGTFMMFFRQNRWSTLNTAAWFEFFLSSSWCDDFENVSRNSTNN